MKISFIVPVLNTEIELLKKCISSIKKIEIDDYEIIVINDGSVKELSEKYEKYLKSDRRIIYIKNKQTSGVSYSRNIGIEKSSKDYIMFVDSDDMIVSEEINNLKIKIKDADMILFDTYVNGKKEKYRLEEGKVEVRDIINNTFYNCNFSRPVAKLYNKSFLLENNIKFNKIYIQGEDAIFNLECLKYNPKIYYYNIFIYNYCYNSKNTQNRLENNFEKFTQGMYDIYNIKKQLISNEQNTNIRKKMLDKNDNQLIKDVFHNYLIMLKINKNDNIEKYKYLLKKININKKILKIKEKIYEYLIISSNPFNRAILKILIRIKKI